ncbi:hypothetical protein [Sorangium sp. So ce1000]|uniref:hypothetical protein n=1 Tax=Sorangium sp. So ce1000 TaxID=3133325 RepID=UPI003F5EE541
MSDCTPKPDNKTPLELHACMGLNACKGHDRFGTNECAGRGYCATAQQHSCHTNNNCRGQGGCGLYGSEDEQNNPGNNTCAWQGSCAVPINAERFSTAGPNKGKSVWKRARALFEQRMTQARRQFGPPPVEEGPGYQWLLEVSDETYNACGSSDLSGGGGSRV